MEIISIGIFGKQKRKWGKKLRPIEKGGTKKPEQKKEENDMVREG